MEELEAKIRQNSFKLLSKQAQAAARAAGRAVDVSAEDFEDKEEPASAPVMAPTPVSETEE